MKIAIAQLSPVVGDFKGNLAAIRSAYEKACSVGARILLTPEVSLFGYPSQDLMDRPEVFDRCSEAFEAAKNLTSNQSCALVVGHVVPSESPGERRAKNLVSVLENGIEVFRQGKALLPAFDIFEESRHFEPENEVKLWECDGKKIGLAVCADLWANDFAFGRIHHGQINPVEIHKKLKPDLLISLSASPYEFVKRKHREAVHGRVAKDLSIPVIYVNQVGATDEILFDGASFSVDSSGAVSGRLKVFGEAFGLIEWKDPRLDWGLTESGQRDSSDPSDIESLYRGLTVGIREYFSRTGFKTAIIGLSGGVDSALVAVLAAHALGKKHVKVVSMASQYSSAHSREDAEALAQNLGTPLEILPIKFMYSTLFRAIAEGRQGKLSELASENLQARIRGLILMTMANHYNALVLTTGNKSELATGYCTQYGDMVGALSPLGDVVKTRVYELCHWINSQFSNVIPERILSKPPSAELRPDQKDEDFLPPYEILDQLIQDYIEGRAYLQELEDRYGDIFRERSQLSVREVIQLIERSEYKRRQAAPALKVSPKAFGTGRRVPIAKTWDF